MKVWWVLAWEQYYPNGGLGNVVGTFETKEEADQFAASFKYDYGSSFEYRPDYVEVENVSEMLGLPE